MVFHRISRLRHLALAPVAALMVVTLASVPADESQAQNGPPTDAGQVPLDQPATVTLVTGDRVTLTPSGNDAQPSVRFEPAPGSEPTGFDVLRDDSGIHVVPDDVEHLIPEVLDPELFNVAGLVEMGYDDANSETLPLIVDRAEGVRTLAASPLRHEATLKSINATVVDLDKVDAEAFGDDLAGVDEPTAVDAADALSGVTKVWLDRTMEAAELDPYLTQIKAPEAWDTGLDGTGVTVAVLDTGVDGEHPALAGQVDDMANFTDDDSAADGHGHGTHVASLLAGTGAGSDGALQGVAPGVDLLSGKVLDDEGQGRASWVIAGMEWAAGQGADVINMSLGGPPTKTDGPLVMALEELTEQSGALFTVAAGNRGWIGFVPGTIDTPGSAPSALTVGAVRATGTLAYFSGQGPTLGSYRLKPDVAAPGVGILGANAGARNDDLYVRKSGTSMATPIVAGAAALLMQQHPDWTWQQVKARVVSTADPQDTQISWSHGGGVLDLERATHQALVADVGSLDFGYLKHPDDSTKSIAVTLRNTGTEAITVDTAAEVKNQTGDAPDGALVASPASLTIPAGETARTVVTFDPSVVTDGLWEGGMSFVSAGETLLQLPFGAYDEPERYDLEVQLLDRNGDPYDPATGADHPWGDTTVPIFNADNGYFYRLRPDENGYVKARVAPGSYSIFGRIITPGEGDDPETFTIAGTSELIVDSDTSYVIDAREADRVGTPAVLGRRTSVDKTVNLSYFRSAESGRSYTEFGVFDAEEVSNGQLYVSATDPVDTGDFEASMSWRLAPMDAMRADEYALVLAEPTFGDALWPTLSQRDFGRLAEVHTMLYPIGESEYWHGVIHQTKKSQVSFINSTPAVTPDESRVLMTADPDVMWMQCAIFVSMPFSPGICDDMSSFDNGEEVDVHIGTALRPGALQAWRSESSVYFRTGFGDGDHNGALMHPIVDSGAVSLYKNGELVDTVDATGGYFQVSDGGGWDPLSDETDTFRLEQEWKLTSQFTRSQEAHTTWTFAAEPPQGSTEFPTETLPLLELDYEAPVDSLGRVSPLQPLRIDLETTVVEDPWVPSPPVELESMRLWWSTDDGATWHESSAQRTGDGSFTGTVPGGSLRSGQSVSLRVTATDTSGSSIDQTVIGIYPVR